MGVPFELEQGKAVSTYADDSTAMELDASKVETASTFLIEYESVTGAKTNAEKSVGLQLGSWRSIGGRSQTLNRRTS